MSENTLENRLQSLNQALSQMMRNTSEREIIDQLTTYKIAIQNTLKILTKKQKQTKLNITHSSISSRSS